MTLDQVHEQNNRVIKSTGGATDLVNKSDQSALIRWETCGPDIARIIMEFEETENIDSPNLNSSKHHEDNEAFCKKFTSDINTLLDELPVNPFQSVKLSKMNNSGVIVPDSVFDVIKGMAEQGEKQFISFINNRLIFQRKPISATIYKNKFKIWELSKIDDKPFLPSSSVINKMRSACEHRPELADTIFKFEILGIPQSLASDSISMYHGKKSDITKRLSTFSVLRLPNKDGKSALVIEMSPVIRAKCTSISDDVICFSDLAVVLFYYVQNLGSSFDRLDLVFDRYFSRV